MKATVPSSTQPKVATKPDAKVKEITESKGKSKHSLVGSTDKTVYPFPKVPADYDVDKHQSLRKKDFADEATFFEYRAVICDAQAKKFRARAEESRAVGGAGEDKKAIKKLMREAAKLKELRAVLSAKGIDVAALIATAEKTVSEKVPEAKA